MLGECEECKEGIHGMQSKRNPNVCMCCFENVGAENLIPNPMKKGW